MKILKDKTIVIFLKPHLVCRKEEKERKKKRGRKRVSEGLIINELIIGGTFWQFYDSKGYNWIRKL